MNGQNSPPERHARDDRGAGPARRLRRGAAAAALAALAALIPALPAAAIGVGGTDSFSLTPAPTGSGQAPAYFAMTLTAGQSATRTVIIRNLANQSQRLDVGPAEGVTAGNGGLTYVASSPRCSIPACWVTGLPGVVTLSAGAAERLSLTVHVPSGTPDGQYLAGVIAGPVTVPQQGSTASKGKVKAGAVIVERIAVGVAITVGKLSQLTERFQIPAVSGTDIGSTARLNIRLDNTGQTFAAAKGTASCTAAGRPHTFAVAPAVILPGESGEIAVNTPGLPEGTTVPCQVRLHYGKDLTTSWAGPVALPAQPRARIVHTGPGAYTVVPVPGTSPWLFALIGVGVLALAALVALAVLLRRMRRHRLAR